LRRTPGGLRRKPHQRHLLRFDASVGVPGPLAVGDVGDAVLRGRVELEPGVVVEGEGAAAEISCPVVAADSANRTVLPVGLAKPRRALAATPERPQKLFRFFDDARRSLTSVLKNRFFTFGTDGGLK